MDLMAEPRTPPAASAARASVLRASSPNGASS